MKATKKELERALEMAVKSLWREWKPGTYCECIDCSINNNKAPYKCGEDDAACEKEIVKHFLALAKQGKKEGR